MASICAGNLISTVEAGWNSLPTRRTSAGKTLALCKSMSNHCAPCWRCSTTEVWPARHDGSTWLRLTASEYSIQDHSDTQSDARSLRWESRFKTTKAHRHRVPVGRSWMW